MVRKAQGVCRIGSCRLGSQHLVKPFCMHQKCRLSHRGKLATTVSFLAALETCFTLQPLSVAPGPAAPPEAGGVREFSGADALPAFLSDLDVLVCVLPGGDGTQGFVDAALLAQLPRGAAFANCGASAEALNPMG